MIYFISDTHLGLGKKEEEEQKEMRLISFLDSIQGSATQLFIVGDLFDAWLEYEYVIPKGYHRLLTKFEYLLKSGIKIHYVAGNHDYWRKNFFQVELGMNLYSDSIEVTIDGKKYYIHHGDGLDTHDFGYKILKKVLRNPINIRLYRWLHPDVGIRLAKFFSRKSRKHSATKAISENNGMVQLATKKISEGFDTVVMGHCHQPEYRRIGTGIYVNLGDWIEHNSYAVAVDGTIELKYWVGK